MTKLVFFSNELMRPSIRHELKVPLEFIAFSHIKGNMYHHWYSGNSNMYPVNTFVLQKDRQWGNNVVYGALYLLNDFDFWIRVLDSYHGCSKSILTKNHNNDIHHREVLPCTPIMFNTLDELARLKYMEKEHVNAHVYLGNQKHPKINKRFLTTKSYRILNGIDVASFTEQFREVSNET